MNLQWSSTDMEIYGQDLWKQRKLYERRKNIFVSETVKFLNQKVMFLSIWKLRNFEIFAAI